MRKGGDSIGLSKEMQQQDLQPLLPSYTGHLTFHQGFPQGFPQGFLPRISSKDLHQGFPPRIFFKAFHMTSARSVNASERQWPLQQITIAIWRNMFWNLNKYSLISEQIWKGSLGSHRCAAYANASVRQWPSRQHFARLHQIPLNNSPSNGGVNGVKRRLAANLHEIVSKPMMLC